MTCERGRYRFTYAEHYRDGGAVPLSTALPIGEGPFRSEDIEAYLEGLLPADEIVARTS